MDGGPFPNGGVPTATYQASFDGFAARGVARAEVARLLRRGVALAAQACAEVAGAGGATLRSATPPPAPPLRRSGPRSR